MKKTRSPMFLSLAAGVLAALALTVSASAYNHDAARLRVYSGQFADVAPEAWYHDNVANAYELGLINGKSETAFDPDGTLTVAETIKLAAVCNQFLTKGATDDSAFFLEGAVHWYDGYVAYAAQRDIVTEVYENYNAPATRGMVAVLFSRAIVNADAAMTEINNAEFGVLPDVPTSSWYATSVYRLYRWGIMTGDENGYLHPETSVRRSEISAIVTRVIDPSVRTRADGSSAGAPAAELPASPGSVLTLYAGTTEAKGLTESLGFAADFTVAGHSATANASYSLDLVNQLNAERDNISFRLYHGAGYEAFSSLREALNAAAVGANGSVLRSGVEVYPRINELFYLWADGKRMTVSGLWYADHDGYTTYAFYLDETLDPDAVTRYQLVCGTPGADTLRLCGLDSLALLVENAYGVRASDEYLEAAQKTEVNNEKYTEAIAAAKAGAGEIPFEYESDRCYILYGAGLYGTGADDYRLMFIFRDGTSQTIHAGRVTAIRVNSAGSVLYYNTKAPDGQEIQHGVNFD